MQRVLDLGQDQDRRISVSRVETKTAVSMTTRLRDWLPSCQSLTGLELFLPWMTLNGVIALTAA